MVRMDPVISAKSLTENPCRRRETDMNRHYCRALIAIPFIIAGALPLAGLSSTCVAAQAARSTQSRGELGPNAGWQPSSVAFAPRRRPRVSASALEGAEFEPAEPPTRVLTRPRI